MKRLRTVLWSLVLLLSSAIATGKLNPYFSRCSIYLIRAGADQTNGNVQCALLFLKLMEMSVNGSY